MDTQRLVRIWGRVQMIVLVPVAFGIVVLEIMGWFSPAVAAVPNMPWGQLVAILVPVLVIYAIGFYIQCRRYPQAAWTEPPKLPVMSDDMRRLAKYGIVIGMVGLCIFLPTFAIKLGNGVGTREWFRNLCMLVMLAMMIPTQVQWVLTLWKKAPEPAA